MPHFLPSCKRLLSEICFEGSAILVFTYEYSAHVASIQNSSGKLRGGPGPTLYEDARDYHESLWLVTVVQKGEGVNGLFT